MKTKLSRRDLLQELDKPEYRAVFQEFSPARFPKNTLIFSLGHTEDMVFIVKKGRGRVYLAFEDKDFSLAILEKGDIYSTHTRSYVMALEDVELLIMPTAKFHQFMISFPVFSKTIVSVLGELLKQTFSIIDSLVFKDVTQRIVEFLLYEARHHGTACDSGTKINVDLTMEQLAAVVGSSRQTVSTIINQMLKSGVLSREGRTEYLVPNLAILKEFPHS
jgi:CRP-like cAMP-binding protein